MSKGNLLIADDGNVEPLLNYERQIDVDVGAAVVGSTAPTPTTVAPVRGLALNADFEVIYTSCKIPTHT